MPTEFSIVVTTTDSEELTERVAGALLERRLAACVQVSAIRSFYSWHGTVRDDNEQLLLVKCRTVDYAEVEATIVALHDYDVPEVVQVPVTDGNEAYLGWVRSQTVR